MNAQHQFSFMVLDDKASWVSYLDLGTGIYKRTTWIMFTVGSVGRRYRLIYRPICQLSVDHYSANISTVTRQGVGRVTADCRSSISLYIDRCVFRPIQF